MGETMRIEEFNELIKHIEKEHFFGKTGKTVKYIEPCFDVRTHEIFSIKFRGYGWDKTLHCVNECRDLELSLFERCMKFLDCERASNEWIEA